MTKEKKRYILLGAAGLALFWVIFLWGFWKQGPLAFGFNATFFLWGMTALFFYATGEKVSKSQNLMWLVPVFFISLSFSLFENPFLKAVSFLLLPVIFAVFASYALMPAEKHWSVWYLASLVAIRFRFLTKIKDALDQLATIVPSPKDKNAQMARRVLLGVGLFLLVAFLVVIPLLSSADPVFAMHIKKITGWFYDLISFKYLSRVIFFVFLGIGLASVYLSLERYIATPKEGAAKAEKKEILLDPVISGIVLGGVLLVYMLFLYTQAKYLWVDMLPIEFKDTERLVKSGFWQLLLLSVINILFFLVYYRKTNKLVQDILKAFTVVSFLLLVSAGERMFLYVVNYGLSYEKIFASYTVLYCALLFVWLFSRLFSARPADTLKFIVFSFLWMYGVLTIMPVEKMIFASNTKLSQREHSRIDLYELTMLSSDVTPAVVSYRADEEWKGRWCWWYRRNTREVAGKKWYEKNFTNLVGIKNSSNKAGFDRCDPEAHFNKLNKVDEPKTNEPSSEPYSNKGN